MEMTEFRLLNVVKFTDSEVKAKRLEAQGYKKVEPKEEPVEEIEVVEETEEVKPEDKPEPKQPAKKAVKKEG